MKTIIEALKTLENYRDKDLICDCCPDKAECIADDCYIDQALARARELERVRQWTTITDDPATWPPREEIVLFKSKLEDLIILPRFVLEHENMAEYKGCRWRYLPEVEE